MNSQLLLPLRGLPREPYTHPVIMLLRNPWSTFGEMLTNETFLRYRISFQACKFLEALALCPGSAQPHTSRE